MSRAMMSFPVPLSPVIRTGTLAAATLTSCERTDCMASEWPKVMLSGGTSPSDCARELTESVVIRLYPFAVSVHPHALKVHPKHQTGEEGRSTGTISLNAQLMNGLQGSYAESKDLRHGTNVLFGERYGKGNIFHTAALTFLKCLPETAAASVFRGRANFNPRRW